MSDQRPTGIAAYRHLIDLDESVAGPASERWADELGPLINLLGVTATGLPHDDLAALQAALAPLLPGELDEAVMTQIEGVLRGARKPTEMMAPHALPTVAEQGGTNHGHTALISLWVGDITRLAADVVVNAANSTLLGCRLPYHFCIDYALHAEAGPRLRRDADLLIRHQGGPEPVGSAKITRGYALASPYVIHTVGPQLSSGAEPTPTQEAQLRSCYQACLDAAAEVAAVSTIAFCAISTGVFAYPKDRAAALALGTVDEWLALHPNRFQRVVFNLFSQADADHYRTVLGLPPGLKP